MNRCMLSWERRGPTDGPQSPRSFSKETWEFYLVLQQMTHVFLGKIGLTSNSRPPPLNVLLSFLRKKSYEPIIIFVRVRNEFSLCPSNQTAIIINITGKCPTLPQTVLGTLHSFISSQLPRNPTRQILLSYSFFSKEIETERVKQLAQDPQWP